MDAKKLKEIIQNHEKWLEDDGGERANLSDADLSHADLRNADLRYADLRNADLRYANLRSADLRSANLSDTESILLSPFVWCHVQRDNIRIGCQYHTTEEWRNFTDDEITEMESHALDWWKRNKPVVMAMAEACEPYAE